VVPSSPYLRHLSGDVQQEAPIASDTGTNDSWIIICTGYDSYGAIGVCFSTTPTRSVGEKKHRVHPAGILKGASRVSTLRGSTRLISVEDPSAKKALRDFFRGTIPERHSRRK